MDLRDELALDGVGVVPRFLSRSLAAGQVDLASLEGGPRLLGIGQLLPQAVLLGDHLLVLLGIHLR